MPSVTESILGTLGSLGGISARRENDGLVATQAHGEALKNKANQILLDRTKDEELAGQLDAAGIVRENLETGAFEVADLDKLVGTPYAALLFGDEANKFFKTPEGVKIAGIRKVPGGLIPNMNPVDETTGSLLAAPTAPPSQMAERWMIELEKPDGTKAPATMNASSAADDQLITLDKEQILAAANSRLARMQVGGAFGNAVTLGRLGLSHTAASDAFLQSMIAEDPDEVTGGDPVANRELYGILPTLKGKDLEDAIRAKGLDPDKLREEAAEKWTAEQEAARKEIVKPNELAPRDYLAVKSALTRSVTEAEKALADYDSKSKDVAELEAAWGPQMTVQQLRDRGGVSPAPALSGGTPNPLAQPGGKIVMKDGKPVWEKEKPRATNTRAKLVKNLENAKTTLGKLGPPPAPKVTQLYPSKFQSGYQPKFEFTDENMRAAAIGKLQVATPEETAQVAQYARDQGVTKAADLAKLPRNDAMALATIIAANTPGTSTEKLALWEKLTNFARTGDTEKSPIGAAETIQKGLVDQANAVTAAAAVRVSADNSVRDYNLGIANLELKWAELDAVAAKAGYDKAADYGKAAKDIYNEYTAVVRNEAMGADPANPQSGDVTIKNTGPTAKMNTAMNGLRTLMTNSPKGSPQYVAAATQYLDALGAYAASVAAFTGRPAGWDLEKQFVNFFFREAATMPVGSMMENLKFDTTPNGEVVKFRALESGPGSKRTEVVAGADTIDRFLGPGTFEFLKEALAVQAQLNAVKKGS